MKAIFLDAVGLIRLQDFPPEDVVDRTNLVTMVLMEWVKVWVELVVWVQPGSTRGVGKGAGNSNPQVLGPKPCSGYLGSSARTL